MAKTKPRNNNDDINDPVVATIRLNEKENMGLLFTEDLSLSKRQIVFDPNGAATIKGNPVGQVRASHLKIGIHGITGEPNPIKRAVMYGLVFVIDGDVGVEPIVEFEDYYDKFTEQLEKLISAEPEEVEKTKIKETSQAIKNQANVFLLLGLDEMTRQIKPILTGIRRFPDRKEEFVGVLRHMLYKELSKPQEEKRDEVLDYVKDLLGDLDPNMDYMFSTVEET